jgi:hypothetical protein
MNKSLVQACFSMKQDRNSPADSINAAEFNLLQFMNLLHNSKTISKEDGEVASQSFDEIQEEE